MKKDICRSLHLSDGLNKKLEDIYFMSVSMEMLSNIT